MAASFSQTPTPEMSFDQQMQQAQHDMEKTVNDKDQPANNSEDRLYSAVSVQHASMSESGKKLTTTQATIIFITNEIGIGVLSLPSAINILGLFPGILCIAGMGMFSLYSALILIQYYRKHPYLLNIVDYGRVLGGPIVEGIFATGFLINMVLTCSSAIITVSIGLNTISDHAMCTLGFTAITAIAMCAVCIPKTMKFVAYCGWPCTVSIVATLLIVMISLGVAGPWTQPGGVALRAFGNSSFSRTTSAFLNVAFAFSGNQAFPTVLAEMKNPSRDFPKAVTIEKCITTTIYIIVAVVCYCFAGDQITSPAIGSAPVTSAKIAYGIIFVSLLGTGLVFGMTASRYIDVAIKRHLHLFGLGQQRRRSVSMDATRPRRRSTVNIQQSSKLTSIIIWIGVVTVFWLVSWIVAGAIPIFDSLLNISASLLLAWATWGIPVVLWFDLNRNGEWHNGWKKVMLAAFNVFILFIVLFMNTGGMYASIDNMLAIFADPNSNINGVFSCADNSAF